MIIKVFKHNTTLFLLIRVRKSIFTNKILQNISSVYQFL